MQIVSTRKFLQRLALGVSLYLCGYALTFGYVWNEKYVLAKQDWPSLGENVWQSSANMPAHFTGCIWPLYWLVRAGIEVTK
jgi:hypothetical protein